MGPAPCNRLQWIALVAEGGQQGNLRNTPFVHGKQRYQVPQAGCGSAVADSRHKTNVAYY